MQIRFFPIGYSNQSSLYDGYYDFNLLTTMIWLIRSHKDVPCNILKLKYQFSIKKGPHYIPFGYISKSKPIIPLPLAAFYDFMQFAQTLIY